MNATVGKRGRFCLRVKFVEGLDRIYPGQVFQVASDLTKSVRFISTTMSHGDPDSANWFIVMHVESMNCELSDLVGGFLVSFETNESYNNKGSIESA